MYFSGPVNSQKVPADKDESDFAPDWSFEGGPEFCAPVRMRGLTWNWTRAGDDDIRPCPAGATGLARWRCQPSDSQVGHCYCGYIL